jgi:hypothetical protein
MPGVKAIESQSAGGHLVKHRSAHVGVTIVAGFFPAMIISHHQYDPGA